MTSSPVLEASGFPRLATVSSRVALVLFALTGFCGLLAEQGFEKYLQILVGATASGAVLCTCFLGFAVGGLVAARLIRNGSIPRPLLAYGLVELGLCLSCVLFSLCFHPMTAVVGLLQNLFAGPAARFQVRFLCGCLLMLPSAALMGASFPLIAHALDHAETGVRKRWPVAYLVNLLGAFTASVAAPYFILPSLGLRAALWICGAIGAAIYGLTILTPGPVAPPFEARPRNFTPFTKEIRLLLAAAFACGLIFLSLEVIWTHLIGAVLGSTVHAFSQMLASVLLGLLLGAIISNRGAKTGRLVRPSLLFQCAALLLMVQFVLWDRLPGFFRLIPPAADSFSPVESFRFYVAILLLAPLAAVLGMIYPRLLASSQLEGENNAYLAGYLSAANALGCLTGAFLGIFVLVPAAGSEVSLKILVLLLGLVWAVFQLREPLPRGRLAGAALVAALLLIVTLGRWWDWGSLTAGLGNSFGQTPPLSASVKPEAVRLLPASFIYRHEDIEGGFTTVVEQTTITGEVGQTVRSLLSNGDFQGDDNPAGAERHTPFGLSAVPSMFVAEYGRALLIGLGTGQGATALKHLGYREIRVAEPATGIAQAAGQSFAGPNEDILADPRVNLYREDGRNVLLTDRKTLYDLISVEATSLWSTGATNLYSREFYELALKRLGPGGVLQQWVQLQHIGPREIASQLATAREVFPYVALWYYGGQGMLLAADHPLITPHFQAGMGMSSIDEAKLVETLTAARLLDSEGVGRIIRDLQPAVNTDQNRRLEYAATQYQSSSYDWLSHNLTLLNKYR